MNPVPDAPLNSGLPSAACRAMIERLISFNTVSRDSNLGLIEWVRDYLQGLGAATRLTHDQTERRQIYSPSKDSKTGLILSDTDVVPVDVVGTRTCSGHRARRQALAAVRRT